MQCSDPVSGHTSAPTDSATLHPKNRRSHCVKPMTPTRQGTPLSPAGHFSQNRCVESMDALSGEQMSTIGSDFSPPRNGNPELEREIAPARKSASTSTKPIHDSPAPTLRDRYEPTLQNESPAYGRKSLSGASQTHNATAEYYENRASEVAVQNDREKETIVDNYRKQIAEERESRARNDGDDTNEYKEKLRKDSDAAIKQAREEVQTERRQARKISDEYESVLKSRDKKSGHLLNSRLHQKDLTNQTKLTENAERDRESRLLEVQPLREVMQEASEMKRDATKAKNLAREETIRDQESEWRDQYRNQTSAHKAEKTKLRSEVDEVERTYGARMGAYMKEKDAKMAQIIARQNEEHRTQFSNAASEYDRSLEQVKLGSKHDQNLSEQRMTEERERSQSNQSEAMQKQASTYQRTLENQRTAQQSQIDNLERVLINKTTTDDPGEISSAAEESVRHAVTKQYQQTFQAEADRNAKSRDQMLRNFDQKLDESREDRQANSLNLNRKNLTEQALMRDTFVHHVSDVEENKRQMLDHANNANQKMSDTSLRTQERSSHDLRRHYEGIIADRDMEATTRMQDFRNQAEFEKRGMRREFTAQNSDLMREHEKKLTAQRIGSEEQLRDLKAKLDIQTRDSDRQLKQTLSDQARSYEHRIAETDAQMKERERMVARNHEDELDKVKKANALLLSKKG